MANSARANPGAVELVLALCHEVGNCLGAVRLQTHLIEAEMSPRDLARATLDVDDLCARSAALLAHIRPLLAASVADPAPVGARELLESVRAWWVEQGGPVVEVEDAPWNDLPALSVDREVLHHLLQSLIFSAMDGDARRVRLSARSRGGAAEVVVSDDGDEADRVDGQAEALRGRPLLLAVAREILARFEGTVRIEREGAFTEVSLGVPAGAEPS